MKTPTLVLLIFSSLISAFSQTEFIVNTTQDSTQRDPHIVRDGAGNYAVVWNAVDYAAVGSRGDIVLQFFDASDAKLGGEVLVDTTSAGDQEKPAAAMNAAGDLIVVWASLVDMDSSYDIVARMFKNRIATGPEFMVNTVRRLTQTEPAVAIDSAGNFVITWDTWTDDNDRDVKGRLYGPDGLPQGGEFTVNTTLAYSQARPAVRWFRNRNFIVTWESWKQDGGMPAGYGVYGRIFSGAGTPLGNEFQVNTTVADYQWYSDVETFDDDSFIVTWCSWGQDGSGGSIIFQRFSSDGSKIGGEVLVNSTTAQYQWLSKIRKFADGSFAVIWSSWKQDGSREGVYLQLFDKAARRTSFETQANTTTASYQWEPDFIPSGIGGAIVVWSSWGQVGKDYDIVRRRIAPIQPEGIINTGSYGHPAGRSTTRLSVHVVDSLAVTGHTYEAIFDTAAQNTKAFLNIRNVTTGDTLVRRYPIDRGEGTFYLTPVFQGVAVQVVPEFDLDIDFQQSYFVNHSGTNLTFALNYPSAGLKKVAPIDVALIWGPTDTLANGNYVTVSDSALPAQGSQKVMVPFRAWNLTDNARMDMVVVESRADKRWNPGEKVVFLTPPQYRTASNNTHVEVRPFAPAGSVVMPAPGDTNIVLTTRPIQQGERYTFATSRALILDVPLQPGVPLAFALSQNYPNPFNPVTTIGFRIPGDGFRELSPATRDPSPGTRIVRLSVYDLLGREVAVLVNERKEPGTYSVRFDGKGFASGVYFSRLEWGGRVAVQKMILLK